MAIEGPLAELSIQDVLQLLELANKTGVLTVRSDQAGDEAIVHFTRGAIVFAVRRRSTRRIGQLLIRAGKLTQRELERALQIQRADPTRRLAEVLLEMGSVAEEELEQQLRFQMEETIYEIMPWIDGYFRFEEREEIGQQRMIARIRVESLLMEGARRIDEWTRLESKVPGPEVVPVLGAEAGHEITPLELRADEWEILAEIDGVRDIRSLAADLGRSAFDVARTVFGLVSMGILDVSEPATMSADIDVDEAVAQVESLLREGRADDAQKLGTQLEAAFPERADLAVLAGRTLLAQNRMRAATEAFSRAVSLDPELVDAHYLLGSTAVRTGDLERAARAWETYLRLAPRGEARQFAVHGLSALRALTQVVTRVTTARGA